MTSSPTSPTSVSVSLSHHLRSATMTIHHTLLSALRSLLRRSKRMRVLLANFLRSLRSPPTPSPELLYAAEISSLFGALDAPAVRRLSRGLQAQFRTALRDNPACMLPSYSHVLPSGAEIGRYVALDVGGSTFRVAVLELCGRGNGEGSTVRGARTFKIDDVVKQRAGVQFFEWLAERIEETLREVLGDSDGDANAKGEKMDMGLSWSFPIEHTSLRSGRIQGMGKGFRAMEGLLGADLADVLQGACDRRHLPVTLTATVNDGASTLLSRAYTTPNTHYGLILGTGVNIAVHLPTNLVSSKLASRASPSPLPSAPASSSPPSLSTSAASSPLSDPAPTPVGVGVGGSAASTDGGVHDYVIVNTEISMFGAGVLPLTRFDVALDAAHPLPGFQPVEMLVSGRYLGEVARLVVVEGWERGMLFRSEGVQRGQQQQGGLPKGWETPYGLHTEVLSKLQRGEACELGLGIGERDGEALRGIAEAVAGRAERVVAACIYALRGVRDGSYEGEGEGESKDGVSTKWGAVPMKGGDDGVVSTMVEAVEEGGGERRGNTVVACAGAVIQFYPGFRAGAQEVLDELCREGGEGRIELCLAEESSLLGAAVSAAVVAGGGGEVR